MEKRFGVTQVCSVGTFSTLQLKAAIQDLSKLYNIDKHTIRSISKRINGLDDKTMEDLFKVACKDEEVKKFLKKYPELFNCIFLILGQPKTTSIHACAMMIFPDEKTLFDWCPVRKQNDLVVSEWEGGELDAAGFLKEDILGIEQLDKMSNIIDLIEKNTGKRIDLYKDIPIDDKEVYKYFSEGFLGDIFHFGAKGLSKYVAKVGPKNIEDLIACICLYRPGPMENNYHNEYLLRKSGQRDVEFPIGGEEVLKDSYGLMYTQEHIMLLCQKLAGFSLQKSDDVRKCMGKKLVDKLKLIRPDFVKGYVERFEDQGVDEDYANDLWDKMEEFGKYGFNKSHAAAYSINGYNSMWLKVHYPVEFWSVTFSRADKKDYPFYINEISRIGFIQLKSIDINKSGIDIVTDKEDGGLYWAINSVTQVGEKVQEQIINERNQNGPYFSFDEFVDRNKFKDSPVNKSSIENLIFSGAFDELEKVKGLNKYKLREQLLNDYREKYKIKIDESKDIYSIARSKGKTKEDWWWQLIEKDNSGFGFFNYKSLVNRYFFTNNDEGKFIELENIEKHLKDYDIQVIGGYVLDFEEKASKIGTFGKILLESNYNIISVNVHAEIYPEVKELLRTCEKTILLLSGFIQYEKFSESNVFQLNDQSKIVKLKLD